MKTYFNQIEMIQSKTDSSKNELTPLIRNRSPRRQHENINHMNVRIQSPKRISLSPLRNRNKNCSVENQKPLLSKKKSFDKICENHQNKIGEYTIQSQFQQLFYCKNCAVRLASQGFEVTKCEKKQQIKNDDENERVQEINDFMDQLEVLTENLGKRKGEMGKIIQVGEKSLEGEIEKIKAYYCQFYQIINEHESRVIEELKRQYQNANQRLIEYVEKVGQAVENSESMKKDIIQSISQVILQAPENEFRPIMNHYQHNLKEHQKLFEDKKYEKQIKVKSLSFKDGDYICQLLIENMKLQWEEVNRPSFEKKLHFEKLLSGRKEKRIDEKNSIDESF